MNAENLSDHFIRVATDFSLMMDYTEEEFALKPKNGGWSMGQLYVHLILASDHFFLKNAKICLEGKGERKKGGTTKEWIFMRIMLGFPPIRLKMPKAIAVEPRQPENIRITKDKLERSISEMLSICDRIPGADPLNKTHHLLFGYLNAYQWCWLNDRHFTHHLLQKRRLDRMIRSHSRNKRSILSA